MPREILPKYFTPYNESVNDLSSDKLMAIAYQLLKDIDDIQEDLKAIESLIPEAKRRDAVLRQKMLEELRQENARRSEEAKKKFEKEESEKSIKKKK